MLLDFISRKVAMNAKCTLLLLIAIHIENLSLNAGHVDFKLSSA